MPDLLNDPQYVANLNAHNARLTGNLLRLAGAMALGGTAVRGVAGLRNMLNRQLHPDDASPRKAVVVEVPQGPVLPVPGEDHQTKQTTLGGLGTLLATTVISSLLGRQGGRAAGSHVARKALGEITEHPFDQLVARGLRQHGGVVGAELGGGGAGFLGGLLGKRYVDQRLTSPTTVAVVPDASAVADKAAGIDEAAGKLLDRAGANLQPGVAPNWMQRRLWGSDRPSFFDKPLHMVGLPLAAGAGLAGGYALTDLVLDSLRKKDQEANVADAKREYEQALQAVAKTAEHPLTRCYTAWEASQASPDKTAAPSLNTALGLYGLALTAATGLGAAGGYGYARQRSRTKALTEAIRRRRAELIAAQPLPITAVPTRREAFKLANLVSEADQTLSRLEQRKQQAMTQVLQQLQGQQKAQAKPATQSQQSQQSQLPPPPSVLSRAGHAV